MIYVVTQGQDSAYQVRGVFDNLEQAQKFKHYHACDDIEEFELNPSTPACHQLCFRATYYLNMRGTLIRRADNDRPDHDDRLRYSVYFGDSKELSCTFFAADERQAAKIFGEKVRAFLAGSAFAYETYGFDLAMSKRLVRAIQMIDGQPTFVATEPF